MRTVWNADTNEWEYHDDIETPIAEIRNYDDRFIAGVVSNGNCLILRIALGVLLASAGYGLVEFICWLV